MLDTDKCIAKIDEKKEQLPIVDGWLSKIIVLTKVNKTENRPKNQTTLNFLLERTLNVH